MSLKHQASYLSLLLYEPAALSLNPRVFTQSSLFEVRYAQKSTYVRKYFYIRCLGLGLCGTFREMYGLLTTYFYRGKLPEKPWSRGMGANSLQTNSGNPNTYGLLGSLLYFERESETSTIQSGLDHPLARR
jgi:hypothetical protein